MAKQQVTIIIEASNPIEANKAKDNLQMLADKLGPAKINKLMELYKNPLKKVAVDTWLATL